MWSLMPRYATVYWCAVCNLENRESCWCNLTQVWRSESQGCLWYNSPSEADSLRMSGVICWYSLVVYKAWEPRTLMSWGRRRWMSQLKRREGIHSSPTYLFYSGPEPIGSFSLRLLIQTLTSSGNNLADTARNNVFPAIWASFSPSRLTQIINNTISNSLVMLEYCVCVCVTIFQQYKIFVHF